MVLSARRLCRKPVGRANWLLWSQIVTTSTLCEPRNRSGALHHMMMSVHDARGWTMSIPDATRRMMLGHTHRTVSVHDARGWTMSIHDTTHRTGVGPRRSWLNNVNPRRNSSDHVGPALWTNIAAVGSDSQSGHDMPTTQGWYWDRQNRDGAANPNGLLWGSSTDIAMSWGQNKDLHSLKQRPLNFVHSCAANGPPRL
eukprot:m.369944 g.369944  ORF g.369944 m.369944 type:complete len:198 (-) comp16680_c1_seq28:1192-1785(-)